MTTDSTTFSEILFGSNPRHSLFIRQHFAHVVALGLLELESYDFDRVLGPDDQPLYCLDLGVRKYTGIAITRVIEIYAHVVHGVIPRNNNLSNIWFPTPYPTSRLLGPLPCDIKFLQDPQEARRLLYTKGTKEEVRAAHEEAAGILISVVDALDFLHLNTSSDPSYSWTSCLSREYGSLVPGTILHYAETVCDQYLIDAIDQHFHGLDKNSDDRFFLELWGPNNNLHINRPEITRGYWTIGQEFTPVVPLGHHSHFETPPPDLHHSQSWGASEIDGDCAVESRDWAVNPSSPQSIIVPGLHLKLLPPSNSPLSMATSYSPSSSSSGDSLFPKYSPPVTRSKASGKISQLVSLEDEDNLFVKGTLCDIIEISD